MKQLGYSKPKVRQIEREEKRWIAAVRVETEYFRVLLASNLKVEKISKRN